MSDNQKKILILGATGMLGHTLIMKYSQNSKFNLYATVRSKKGIPNGWLSILQEKLLDGIDALHIETLEKAVQTVKPDIIINCIGLIKQLEEAKNPLLTISINALFPHQLAELCARYHARLIHISTDCVFDGQKGNYTETDISDAEDLYGRTKFLGEVDYPHAITIRTSIIGHEVKTKVGLVEWFLSQKSNVKGFTKAIYTGFPTTEMARIIADYVIPNPTLSGVYHISSESINKYELLKIIKEEYDKDIEIEPFDEFVIDRSLNSEKFRSATGYMPPSWSEMITEMYDEHHV
jgi:dTDP-4-dehydrorhamnose reductase